MSKSQCGGFGCHVLRALDGGETDDENCTEARLRMSRQHRRRRGTGAVGTAAPLPGVDQTLVSPPIHKCEVLQRD